MSVCLPSTAGSSNGRYASYTDDSNRFRYLLTYSSVVRLQTSVHGVWSLLMSFHLYDVQSGAIVSGGHNTEVTTYTVTLHWHRGVCYYFPQILWWGELLGLPMVTVYSPLGLHHQWCHLLLMSHTLTQPVSVVTTKKCPLMLIMVGTPSGHVSSCLVVPCQ